MMVTEFPWITPLLTATRSKQVWWEVEEKYFVPLRRQDLKLDVVLPILAQLVWSGFVLFSLVLL